MTFFPDLKDQLMPPIPSHITPYTLDDLNAGYSIAIHQRDHVAPDGSIEKQHWAFCAERLLHWRDGKLAEEGKEAAPKTQFKAGTGKGNFS